MEIKKGKEKSVNTSPDGEIIFTNKEIKEGFSWNSKTGKLTFACKLD